VSGQTNMDIFKEKQISADNIKAVIFDMDGVIFDSERAVIEAWKEVAGQYGVPDIESYCIQCLGMNASEARKRFTEIYSEKYDYDRLRDEKTQKVIKMFEDGKVGLKPGITELLVFLRTHSYKTAVASSTREAAVRRELTSADIIQYFDEIVTGDMVEKSKPDPEIFAKACEKLNVRPDQSIGIEDSFNGVRSSSSAGLYTIMVPDMIQPDEEIKKTADLILPDLISVRRIVFGDV